MNFNKNFDNDYIYCGKIDLDWDMVQTDLKSILTDTTRLTSIIEHNDHVSKELSQVTNQYSLYGYTAHNTKIWKTTNGPNKLEFAWEQHIIAQLPLDCAVATLTRQDPGQILPWHMDRFFFLKQQHPNDTRPIWRFLVFMEDWKLGHVLQVKDSILTHWKQGDIVVWHPGTDHLSANVGLAAKWTCNITGFLTI